MIDEAKETYQINLFLREELRRVSTLMPARWRHKSIQEITSGHCFIFCFGHCKTPLRNVYTQNGGSIPQSSGLNDESEAFAYIQSLVQNIESVIYSSHNNIATLLS